MRFIVWGGVSFAHTGVDAQTKLVAATRLQTRHRVLAPLILQAFSRLGKAINGQLKVARC